MNPFSPPLIQPLHKNPNPYKNIQYIIKNKSPENHGLFMNLLNPFFNSELIDSYFPKVSNDSLFFSREIPKKFSKLSEILSNEFLKESQKTEFLDVFCRIQKGLNGIQRFVYLYRFKKSRVYNITDLCGDPIPTNPRLSLTIYQNNTRYVFLLRELIKIVTSAISNSIHFFSDPIPCKNPYTNLPFEKSVLYNIYFAIRFSSLKLPELFHRYFLHNFHLYDYYIESEEEIREEYLISFIKDIGTNLKGDIRDIVHNIFQENKIFCLYIHHSFPEDRLLSIMRPYIELFYKSKYSLKRSYSNHLNIILKYQLLQFIKFNRNFGRSIMKKTTIGNRNIRVLDFNDKHIKFSLLNNIDYKDSHIINSSDSISNMIKVIRESKKWDFIRVADPIYIYDDEGEKKEDENDADQEVYEYSDMSNTVEQEEDIEDNDTQILSEDDSEEENMY